MTDPSGRPASAPWAVSAERVVPATAAQAWALLVDARHHGRIIPLTAVTGDDPGVGAHVRAVSGPPLPGGRRVGVVDRMHITRFEPPAGRAPGSATFVKDGPLLLGSARIDVVAVPGPGGAERARVTWSEEVHLAGPLPARVTGPLVRPFLAGMLRFALRRAAVVLRG